MEKTILIIDDDRVTVHWLQARLEAGGFTVFVALDGVVGLEMARNVRPDLIILDVILPELNGFSVCGFLRADHFLCDTPIVMITARREECDEKFDHQFSPNAFLTKPFDMEEIFEKIEEFV